MSDLRITEICEGEILEVQSELSYYGAILYTCKVFLPNGNILDVSDVQQSSMFGGIGNYTQYRARAREDSPISDDPHKRYEPGVADSSVGERVYIAFIAGNIRHPVIIAFKQHTAIKPEFLAPSETKPRYARQINGVRETITPFGTWRLQRRGAPAVSYVKNGLNGAGLGGTSINNWVTMESYGQGIFRIRDPKGGNIEFDNVDKKGIYISTNDYTASEALFMEDPPGSDTFVKKDPESEGLKELELDPSPGTGGWAGGATTDAEYIWLNRDKNLIAIHSRKDMVIDLGEHMMQNIGKTRYVSVAENDGLQVKGSRREDISGGHVRVVGGQGNYYTGDFHIHEAKQGYVFTSEEGGFNVSTEVDFFVTVSNNACELDMTEDGEILFKSDGGFEYAGTDGGRFTVGEDGTFYIGNDSVNLVKIVKILALNIEQLATAIKAHTHTGNLFFPTAPPDPATLGVMTGVETIAKNKQEEAESISE